MNIQNLKTRGKKYCAAAAVICTCVQICGACAGQDIEKKEKIYVGVACYNQADTFLTELLSAFSREMEAKGTAGVETAVTVKDAVGSQKTQNDQVKELIDAGCNVLCVNLVDRSDPSEIIDLARDNNVPIIFFNREPVAEDMMQWEHLYYVGADAKQSGVLQGEIASAVIRQDSRIDRNNDGKIQYIVLEGEPGHQDTIIRTENAVDTLKNSGIRLEKLSYGIGNWNRAQAQNRMLQMIDQYQNKIELVLANNDDMALGAVEAYKKLNYTESAIPVFFGIDGTDAGLKAVEDGVLAGTVYNDKEGQAEAMADLSEAVVLGKENDEVEFQNGRYIYLSYEKVTQENVTEFQNRKAASDHQ